MQKRSYIELAIRVNANYRQTQEIISADVPTSTLFTYLIK